MKTVETPWYRVSKWLLLVFGIPLTLIGVVLFFILDGNLAVLLNGIIWIIIGGSLKIKGGFDRRNLEILKKEGHYYEGSVVNIIPAQGVRIGSYITARVECVYKTEKGNGLIKSGYHLLSPFDRRENLYAKIYFDSNNSTKYAVELFRRENESVNYSM